LGCFFFERERENSIQSLQVWGKLGDSPVFLTNFSESGRSLLFGAGGLICEVELSSVPAESKLMGPARGQSPKGPD
jgi:hypothetical protein